MISKRSGSSWRVSSRLDETYQSTTLSPFLICAPLSSTSAVAVRRKCANAGYMRSDSSTSEGISDGSSSTFWRSAGFSISARMPLQ